MGDPNPKGISTHIPVLIFLQICFIILFGAFTRYKPNREIINICHSSLKRYDFRSGFKNQDAGEFGVGTSNPHNMILKTWPSMNFLLYLNIRRLSSFLRFPGCSRDDLCRLRFPDDLPKKVRPLGCVPQSPGGGVLHPVAHPGLRLPASPL